jgi:hypothetical protein
MKLDGFADPIRKEAGGGGAPGQGGDQDLSINDRTEAATRPPAFVSTFYLLLLVKKQVFMHSFCSHCLSCLCLKQSYKATKPGGFAHLIKTGEGRNVAQDPPIKEKVQAATEYKTFVSAMQSRIITFMTLLS